MKKLLTANKRAGSTTTRASTSEAGQSPFFAAESANNLVNGKGSKILSDFIEEACSPVVAEPNDDSHVHTRQQDNAVDTQTDHDTRVDRLLRKILGSPEFQANLVASEAHISTKKRIRELARELARDISDEGDDSTEIEDPVPSKPLRLATARSPRNVTPPARRIALAFDTDTSDSSIDATVAKILETMVSTGEICHSPVNSDLPRRNIRCLAGPGVSGGPGRGRTQLELERSERRQVRRGRSAVARIQIPSCQLSSMSSELHQAADSHQDTPDNGMVMASSDHASEPEQCHASDKKPCQHSASSAKKTANKSSENERGGAGTSMDATMDTVANLIAGMNLSFSNTFNTVGTLDDNDSLTLDLPSLLRNPSPSGFEDTAAEDGDEEDDESSLDRSETLSATSDSEFETSASDAESVDRARVPHHNEHDDEDIFDGAQENPDNDKSAVVIRRLEESALVAKVHELGPSTFRSWFEVYVDTLRSAGLLDESSALMDLSSDGIIAQAASKSTAQIDANGARTNLHSSSDASQSNDTSQTHQLPRTHQLLSTLLDTLACSPVPANKLQTSMATTIIDTSKKSGETDQSDLSTPTLVLRERSSSADESRWTQAPITPESEVAAGIEASVSNGALAMEHTVDDDWADPPVTPADARFQSAVETGTTSISSRAFRADSQQPDTTCDDGRKNCFDVSEFSVGSKHNVLFRGYKYEWIPATVVDLYTGQGRHFSCLFHFDGEDDDALDEWINPNMEHQRFSAYEEVPVDGSANDGREWQAGHKDDRYDSQPNTKFSPVNSPIPQATALETIDSMTAGLEASCNELSLPNPVRVLSECALNRTVIEFDDIVDGREDTEWAIVDESDEETHLNSTRADPQPASARPSRERQMRQCQWTQAATLIQSRRSQNRAVPIPEQRAQRVLAPQVQSGSSDEDEWSADETGALFELLEGLSHQQPVSNEVHAHHQVEEKTSAPPAETSGHEMIDRWSRACIPSPFQPRAAVIVTPEKQSPPTERIPADQNPHGTASAHQATPTQSSATHDQKEEPEEEDEEEEDLSIVLSATKHRLPHVPQVRRAASPEQQRVCTPVRRTLSWEACQNQQPRPNADSSGRNDEATSKTSPMPSGAYQRRGPTASLTVSLTMPSMSFGRIGSTVVPLGWLIVGLLFAVLLSLDLRTLHHAASSFSNSLKMGLTPPQQNGRTHPDSVRGVSSKTAAPSLGSLLDFSGIQPLSWLQDFLSVSTEPQTIVTLPKNSVSIDSSNVHIQLHLQAAALSAAVAEAGGTKLPSFASAHSSAVSHLESHSRVAISATLTHIQAGQHTFVEQAWLRSTATTMDLNGRIFGGEYELKVVVIASGAVRETHKVEFPLHNKQGWQLHLDVLES